MMVDTQTARRIVAEIRKKYMGKPWRYRELKEALIEYPGVSLQWDNPYETVKSDEEFVFISEVYKLPWAPKTWVRVTICPTGTDDEEELKRMEEMVDEPPDPPVHVPDVDEAARGGYFSF